MAGQEMVGVGRLKEMAEAWIRGDPDPQTQAELRRLLDATDAGVELADRFTRRLGFGTAGLRAVLAAGPARMNRAVVMRATWAVAQELLADVSGAAERGVVVGGDARRMSRAFCEDAAVILAAAGLRVVLFSSPVPTPLVAFAVKSLGAAAGIAITASHNPAEYNGYKLYWENGAQVTAPVDGHIEAAMDRAPAARDIARPELEALTAAGRVCTSPGNIERAYLDAVLGLRREPRPARPAISVVHTALHGVADSLATRALGEAGFAVTSVPEQRRPDPSFPTVRFPNPEEPGAMDLGLALAERTGAHLLLANDPDGDRLAVAVSHHGQFRTLTGNQIGVLLGHYLLTHRSAKSNEGAGPLAVVSSIVSTPMLGIIARDLGVHYEETLTGCKWIANRAIELERDGYTFVFGFEEALGYCIGDVVRDKDGIAAAVVVAELVASARARGHTLFDELDALARRWGAFASAQLGVTKEGPEGPAAISAMMNTLRRSPPCRVGDEEVVAISDYDADPLGGLVGDAAARPALRALPRSDVLVFRLASGGRVIVRPSGTEPKAKFYVDVIEAVREGESVRHATSRANLRATALKEACLTLALGRSSA
jgi:phosphomannomutase